MIGEIHINGRLSIIVAPETEIERLVFKQMAALAENGKPVKLAMDEAGVVTVSVDK